jgi:beta-xylosidase
MRKRRALSVVGACAALLATALASAPAEALPPAPGGDDPTLVSSIPMADPFVLEFDSTYYAFVSNYTGPSRNVPWLSSSDPMTSWAHVDDALPDLGSWANEGNTWAPGVLPRQGRFVLFYTARHRASGKQCIGRATSTVVTGPYKDKSGSPFICQLGQNGSIDPAPFVAPDGVPYLLWKSEGVIGKSPTRFYSQRLSAKGTKLVGAKTKLLSTKQPWEGSVIENPAMLFANGKYWVFYSANIWSTANYATGVAKCQSPKGPCHRVYRTPIVGNRGFAIGPGGPTFFQTPDGTQMLGIHAWTYPKVGYENGGERRLYALELTFPNGLPKAG